MTSVLPHWVPEEVLSAKTMLSEQELGLLYGLARDRYTGEGEIVDGGAFLGGSTLALACGVRDNPRIANRDRRVHSYDFFVADSYTLRYLPGYPEGVTTRPVFDRVIAPVAAHVEVNEGDIRTMAWPPDRPIEILFIDIAKTWDTNDFILHHFFPRLMPGVSHVIHQDYHWPHTPWISTAMELLRDYFSYLGSVRWCTAVYRCERAIPESVLPRSLTDVGVAQLRALADQAQRWPRGSRKWAAQQCNVVALCLSFGQVEDAAAIYEDLVGAAPELIEEFDYRPNLPVRT